MSCIFARLALATCEAWALGGEALGRGSGARDQRDGGHAGGGVGLACLDVGEVEGVVHSVDKLVVVAVGGLGGARVEPGGELEEGVARVGREAHVLDGVSLGLHAVRVRVSVHLLHRDPVRVLLRRSACAGPWLLGPECARVRER